MKKLSVFLCGVLFTVLLAGCGSTPSLEDQVKLLEYEKCISAEEAAFAAVIQNRTREEVQTFFKDLEKEDPLVSSFIERCSKYRP